MISKHKKSPASGLDSGQDKKILNDMNTIKDNSVVGKGLIDYTVLVLQGRMDELAKPLYEKGFELCPIAPGKKYPANPGWPNADTASLVKAWPDKHGVGIRTGIQTGIDIDVYNKRIVNGLLHCFDGVEILTRIGLPPKALVPVICPEVKKKICSDKWVDKNGVINQIELLSYGQQFVAFGIHPDTKKPYRWSGDLLAHELPVIPLAMIDFLFATFNKLAERAGWTNITIKERKTCRIRKARNKNRNKPGDVYNRCCSISNVLEEYGWKHYRGDYWTRPGKTHGVSGTVFDDNTFYCFTSSTCLEPGRSYDCFGLLAMYEYGGNFTAAAKAVRRTLQEVA